MSYGASACSSWIIPATHENFCKIGAIPVGLENDNTNKRLLEDKDYYEAWLQEMWYDQHSDIEIHTSFGIGAWIWVYSDGDIYDDLDEGEFYISFAHNDLFIPSRVMIEMERKGVIPEHTAYVQFG